MTSILLPFRGLYNPIPPITYHQNQNNPLIYMGIPNKYSLYKVYMGMIIEPTIPPPPKNAIFPMKTCVTGFGPRFGEYHCWCLGHCFGQGRWHLLVSWPMGMRFPPNEFRLEIGVYPPRKLTWNLKIHPLEKEKHLQTTNFWVPC